MDIFNNSKMKALKSTLEEATNKLAKIAGMQDKLEVLQKNFGLDMVNLDDLAAEFSEARERAMGDFAHVSNLYRSAKETAIFLGSMPDQVVELYFIETNSILDIDIKNRMTAVFSSKTSKIEYTFGFGDLSCIFKEEPEEWVEYNKDRIFAIRSVIDQELPKRKYALENLLNQL